MATTAPAVLVPLDGSPLAEAVLPYASTLARAANARLMLVVVWENIEETLLLQQPDLAAQIALSGQEACKRYAEEHAASLSASGVPTDISVVNGKPAQEILRLAGEGGVRFIAMGTHGRSGIGRWWFGSVASAIVRQSPVPVCVVGPDLLQSHTAAPRIERILVPLDGSEVAEEALRIAAGLAEATGARLVLAQVLRWSTQAFLFGVPDVDAARVDEDLTKAAAEYLEQRKASLKMPVDTRVLHGVPADELLKTVESDKIDLVVMGTHGRGALMRFALGSVAERMTHGNAPVLLVREAPTPPSA